MMLIICGTNRPEAVSRGVAGAVVAKLTEMGESSTLIDLADLPPEIFDPKSYAEKPAAFAPFQKLVDEADSLLFVTPEYNGGFPGVLKYFIDMLSFPRSFQNKPAAIIGVAAGHFGAVRPADQLGAVLQYLGAHLFAQRVLMFRAGGMKPVGKVLGNDEFQSRFEKMIEDYAAWVKALKAV